MRRAALVAVVVVAVLAAGIGWRTYVDKRRSGVERTTAALLDDERFGNGPEAATAFGDASKWLFDEGRACDRSDAGRSRRCDLRMSAAAYTGVAAFVLAECTAPGVDAARRSLLSYLRAIERFDASPVGTVEMPSPPDIPKCEGP